MKYFRVSKEESRLACILCLAQGPQYHSGARYNDLHYNDKSRYNDNLRAKILIPHK